MKLTDVEIPLDKLYEYCLNPEHPRGGYKAILFEQTLGISRKNADVLYELLQKVVKETDAQLVRSDKFGDYFRIDYELDGIRGKETLRSTWMIPKGSQRARLISCFIKRRKR
jgi:hypothetical protein